MGGQSIVKLRIHVHKKAKQSVKIPQQSTKINIILLPVLTVVLTLIKLSFNTLLLFSVLLRSFTDRDLRSIMPPVSLDRDVHHLS